MTVTAFTTEQQAILDTIVFQIEQVNNLLDEARDMGFDIQSFPGAKVSLGIGKQDPDGRFGMVTVR